jgi:hypothetical protein
MDIKNEGRPMISFRDLLFKASSALVFSVFAMPVSAIDYDAGQEFSNIQNPNGVWSYRGVTTGASNLVGSYLLNELRELGDFGIIAWQPEGRGGTISIGNDNGRFETFGMTPGEGEDALMAFESKASLFGEIADVTINVYDGSDSTESNGQILSVWKNDSLLEGPIDLPPIFDDFQIRLTRVKLAAGDYVFLRLSADESGIDWGSDVIDFDMVVSTTPITLNPSEPSSAIGIPLLPPIGLAVLGLLIFVAGLRFISGRK